MDQQRTLADQARALAQRGIPVLVSNHDTAFTRTLYREAALTKFSVQRFIRCKGQARNKVSEILALFTSCNAAGPSATGYETASE